MTRQQIVAVVAALTSLVALVTPAAAQSYTTVVVQRGDSLGKIARSYCADWQEIYNMNWQTIGPNPNIVEPGTVLTMINRCGGPVPQPGGVYDRGPRTYATGAYQGGYYYVAWGDTLAGIAQRFGTTVAALRQVNGLQGTTLQAGQTLAIAGAGPQPPQPPQPPAGGPQRIHFRTGATSATLSDTVRNGARNQYVLGALAGQWMQVTVSASSPLPVTITTASGQVLGSSGASAPGYTNVVAQLPARGDYIVTVGPASGPANYNIVFDIR